MNLNRRLVAAAVVSMAWLLPTIVSAQQKAARAVAPFIDTDVGTSQESQIARVRSDVSEKIAVPTLTHVGSDESRTIQSQDEDKKVDTTVVTSRLQVPSTVAPKIIRANCGPILLEKVFAKHGIDTTVDGLIKLSGTRLGVTTLYDMKRTVSELGLHAVGLNADLETLAQLIKSGDVICHYTQNNHYTWIQSVDGKQVGFIDPAWTTINEDANTVWRRVFEQQWRGVCLFISNEPIDVAKTLGKGEYDGSYQILSDEKMRLVIGGTSCSNSDARGGSQEAVVDPYTRDPVDTRNGNLIYEYTDFSYPIRGGGQIALTRRYDAQAFSYLENWQPEDRSGTWVIQNGVYNGQGDRSVSQEHFVDTIIELDMRTVTPGAEAWETAWVNFRYKDKSNRYYVALHQAGSTITAE